MTDFEALRRERDANIMKVLDAFCEKHGWDRSQVTFHSHDIGGCYCACPTGPCEHEFTGWREFTCDDGGGGGEQACKKCGMGAMAHTLRTAP